MGIEKSKRLSKNPKKPKDNKKINKPKEPKKDKKNEEIEFIVERKKSVKRLKPAKAKPPKAEPAKAKPAKAKPSKVELAKTKPDKAKPAKVQLAKADTATAKPAKAKLVKVEPAKSEPAKAEPARAEPTKAEPAKPKQAKAEPVNSKPSEEKINKPKELKKHKILEKNKVILKRKKSVKRLKPAKAKPAKAKPVNPKIGKAKTVKPTIAKAKLEKPKQAMAKSHPSHRHKATTNNIQENVSVTSTYYVATQVKAWCKGDCNKAFGLKKKQIGEDVVVPVRMVLHGPLVPFPNYSSRITGFICNHLAYVALGAVILNVFLFTRSLNYLRAFKSHPFLCYLHPIFCSSFNLFAALGILMMYKYDSATFMFVLEKRKRTSIFCKLFAYACLCFGTLFLFHYAPWSFYTVSYPDSLHSWFGVVAVIFGFSSLTFLMKDFKWGQKKRKMAEFLYAIAFIFNNLAMAIAIINCIMFTSFPYSNMLYRTILVLLCQFIVILVAQKPVKDWYKAYIAKQTEDEINIH